MACDRVFSIMAQFLGYSVAENILYAWQSNQPGE